ILFRTSSVCETQAASSRALTSIAMELALIKSRTARPTPSKSGWERKADLIAGIVQPVPVRGFVRRSHQWRCTEDTIRYPNQYSNRWSDDHPPQGRCGAM